MVRIKVCGIKTEADAIGAASSGADFIGVVFAPSRRQVTAENARSISAALKASGGKARLVGVFVNAAADDVNRVAEECALDLVQLSGDETFEYCALIERPVIKAVRVGKQLPEIVRKDGLICLLDTHVAGIYGGTGETFDWSLAQEASRRFPVILAGGLTPENVAHAIEQVRPWGVDVSSGVETGGVKDMEKINSFIAAARRVDGNRT